MKAKHATSTAIAAAAALAVAAPGAAQATVPSGVIEHRVYDVSADVPAPGMPKQMRVEHFVATDRDRAVISDATTGRLVAETTKDGVVIRDFDATTNVLTTSRAGIPGRNFTMSRADDGANVTRLLSTGVLTITGATTWNGRAAQTARFDGAERYGQDDAAYVIDAATKQVLEIDGTEGPAFERTLVLDEDLPATPENATNLAMLDHPGAIVAGSAAKASRRAKKAAKRAAARRATVRKLARG